MRFFTKALLLAAIMPASAVAAVVPELTDDPVTITVDYSTGTLSGSGSTFKSRWTSTDDKTGLVIDVAQNNIKFDSKINEGPLTIHAGSSHKCTFNFSFGEGWYISSYSFTASVGTGASNTITHNGTATTASAGNDAVVSETLTKDTPASIILEGPNNAVVFNDFKVTLSPASPDDPALVVDPAPEADANCLLAPTNIVNGRFNTFTTWYHLMDGKSYLTGATLADAGSNAESAYNDEYLFCAVKTDNGYVLYNKAAGVAAPVAGANLTATALTVNGAAVTPMFAQKFAAVKVSEGTIKRTDGNVNNNAWQGQWISNSEPTVIFSGSSNNMTTTENPQDAANRNGDFQLESGSNGSNGNFTWNFSAGIGNSIYSYSFLARTNGEYDATTTVTPNGGSAVTLTTHNTRISAEGFDDTRMASFVQNSINGKGMIMSDCYVTVRRSLIPSNTRAGIKLFPHQGVERRIPAIARVFEGEHAGRLVAIFDYRHHGSDIGFSGNISLQIVTSDDNGQTWTEPDYLRNAQGVAVTTPPDSIFRDKLPIAQAQQDPNKYWNYAFGDAALVADRESGKLLLMAVGGPTSLWSGRYDKPNQCVRWFSEDGGQTWSDPERITYDLLDLFNGEPVYGKIDSHFIGSGRIMQSRYVKVGDYYRVYAVMASQNDGNSATTRNWVLYSDDFGKNWNVLGGTDVCPVMIGRGDECKAEELPDGSVMIAGRCRTGNRNFNIFRYTNATKAEGHWMDAVLTDMGFGTVNACDGEIMILPVVDNETNEQIYLALQSFPYGGGRNYVSIAYKALRSGTDFATPDCFTSFDGRYRISSGASVYSTMAWQANNKLAFFWEEGSPISGCYLDLALEEITDGRYTYSEDKGNKVAIEMTRQLLDYRAENDDFESKYVGQPIRSKELFDQAVESYAAVPSYRTYVAANKLEYEGNGLMQVVAEGGYRLTSAHDGHYASFTNPIFMASDGTKMTSTEAEDNSSIFVAKTAETEGAFKFLNKEHNKYVAVAPSAASTQFTMADTEANAGEYFVSSVASGHSVVSSTNGGTYSAMHLDAGRKIVTWTTGAIASRWYMELIDAPAGYEVPEPTMPETDTYEFDYEKNQPFGQVSISEIKANGRPARYFDLQGRAVVNPKRGIFITPEGRKVVL